MKIFKYRLYIKDNQRLELPKGSKILKVDKQKDDLYLWALIDDGAQDIERREIVIIGTGNPIEQDYGRLHFLNTVVMDFFVWHVFELI